MSSSKRSHDNNGGTQPATKKVKTTLPTKFTFSSIKVGRTDSNVEKHNINKPVLLDNILCLRDMSHTFSSPEKIENFEFFLENKNARGAERSKIEVRRTKEDNFKLDIQATNVGKLIVQNTNNCTVDIYFHYIKLDGIYVYRAGKPQTQNAYSLKTWDDINDSQKQPDLCVRKNYIYNESGKLGKGGQGSVYKCYALETGKIYAMKVHTLRQHLDKSIVDTIKLQKNLADEISGIPKIEEHFVVSGLPTQRGLTTSRTIYEVQEYIDGYDLFDVVDKNRFEWYTTSGKVNDEEVIFNVFKQILNTLKSVHSKKCMHRDIKPSNIMIQRKDGIYTVYLVDFGFARENELSSRPKSSFVGTIAYMAPELFLTKNNFTDGYDEKVDIYSLGLVLFFMVCRQHAGRPEKRRDAYAMKNVSSNVQKVIESLLINDADGRETLQGIMDFIDDADKLFPDTNYGNASNIDPRNKLVTDENAKTIVEFLENNNAESSIELRNKSLNDEDAQKIIGEFLGNVKEIICLYHRLQLKF